MSEHKRLRVRRKPLLLLALCVGGVFLGAMASYLSWDTWAVGLVFGLYIVVVSVAGLTVERPGEDRGGDRGETSQ